MICSLDGHRLYHSATEIDPEMGGAWINMGTTLAEAGNLLDAELMFLKALECKDQDDVKVKGMMNLALLLQKRANELAPRGDFIGAISAINQAGELVDEAKHLLDARLALGGATSEESMFASQAKPLRVQIHRLKGQILAGSGDLEACEKEFRTACEKFGDIPLLWEALARVLDIRAKPEEAKRAREKLDSLK